MSNSKGFNPQNSSKDQISANEKLDTSIDVNNEVELIDNAQSKPPVAPPKSSITSSLASEMEAAGNSTNSDETLLGSTNEAKIPTNPKVSEFQKTSEKGIECNYKEAKLFLDQNQVVQLTRLPEDQTAAFLTKAFEGKLKLNLLTRDVEFNGKSLNQNRSEGLSAEDRITVYCEDNFGILFKNRAHFVRRFKDLLSQDGYSYHPVKKYLKSLGSAKPVNIDNLAERYFNNKDELANILVKKTLIAAVARIMNPGCKFDMVLVLYSSQQGLGKSTFLQTLAKNSEWFNDTVPEIKLNKDSFSKFHQYWITEIGEIDTKFNRIKMEQIKDFITSTRDTFRPAYTASELKLERQFILTGTTNNNQLITDPTGSRRYGIVEVKQKIDISTLKDEVDGIWLSAFQAYNNGEQWWLTDEEEKLLEKSNKKFTKQDPWHSMVNRYLQLNKNAKYINPQDVIRLRQLNVPLQEQNKQNSSSIKRIRKLLRSFGYFPQEISNQQRETLFNDLENTPGSLPQVYDLSDIPFTIWVKDDNFIAED
ncbi:MAG: virulence-associated E family protein [Cyanobacteria bacterium J06621_8]